MCFNPALGYSILITKFLSLYLLRFANGPAFYKESKSSLEQNKANFSGHSCALLIYNKSLAKIRSTQIVSRNQGADPNLLNKAVQVFIEWSKERE